VLIQPTDNCEPEEGRIAREADRLRPENQAIRHIAEPGVPEILLSIRQGRGASCVEEQAVNSCT
jgi:hypothetical protein